MMIAESDRYPTRFSYRRSDTRQGIGHSLAIVTRISSHNLGVFPANECPVDNRMMTMRNKAYPTHNYGM
jgi:hypothetical protein